MAQEERSNDQTQRRIDERPLRVDVHTHILPPTWPDFQKSFGYGGWIHLEHHCKKWARMMKDDGTFFREVESDLWNPESRIEYCDRMGIDMQVLSTVPVMFSYWAKPKDTLTVCRLLNDHIAGLVKKYPTRFAGLATLPMQSPDLAVKELRRCVNELNISGIQIGSHINDWTLDDARLFPIFEECERLGACVFVHPWDMMGRSLMKKYWLPWLVSMPAETSLAICSFIFGGIFERLPRLRVLFAHGGGSFPATVGRVQHGFDCRPDLCAIDNPHSPEKYLGRFWVDSLIHGKDMLRFVASLLGYDRVCLGSDYPFPLGECYPLKRPGALIEDAELDERREAQMLGMNALIWLGMNDPTTNRRLLNAPHRARSSAIRRTLIDSLVGEWTARSIAGTLRLNKSRTFELSTTKMRLTGRWKVGTYTSAGLPTGDVILKTTRVVLTSDAGPIVTPWIPQDTPFELNVCCVEGKKARVVEGPLDAFKPEHVKRRSGKNTLIEGQKRPNASNL